MNPVEVIAGDHSCGQPSVIDRLPKVCDRNFVELEGFAVNIRQAFVTLTLRVPGSRRYGCECAQQTCSEKRSAVHLCSACSFHIVSHQGTSSVRLVAALPLTPLIRRRQSTLSTVSIMTRNLDRF